MREFGYERPTRPTDALAVLAGTPGARYLGGGTNLVDLMKLGVETPGVLVDVTALPYDVIEDGPGGGLRVGSRVRNSDLAANLAVRRRYPARTDPRAGRGDHRGRAAGVATCCELPVPQGPRAGLVRVRHRLGGCRPGRRRRRGARRPARPRRRRPGAVAGPPGRASVAGPAGHRARLPGSRRGRAGWDRTAPRQPLHGPAGAKPHRAYAERAGGR